MDWCQSRTLYFYEPEKQSVLLWQTKWRKIFMAVSVPLLIRKGKLWVGCLEGVYIIDLHSRSSKGEFQYRHLNYKLDDPSSRLIEKITCFYQGKDGTLWLGSNGYGIYQRKIDAQGKEQFISYSTAQGLPNNSIREYWKITTVTYGSVPIMDSPVITRQRIVSLTIPYRMV